MTFLDRLLGITPITTAAATVPVPVGTAATSEGALRELDPAAAAAFGISGDGSGAVTRTTAMRVPGIRRGRNLIAGTIATLPLVCTRRTPSGEVESIDSPLLAQLDPATVPAFTIAWTVDDLLFHGLSWWRVTARDTTTDYPRAVEWLQRDRVQIVPATAHQMGRVYVDGHEAADRDLIRFDALDAGLLADGGADTINLALALARAARRVADDDWSGLVLRLADGAPELSREQVVQLLTDWDTARRERSTADINRAVDPHIVGVNAQDRQLSELAGEVASDLARMLNLPPSRIGAPQGSGMTYTNTEADRRDLVDTTLAPFLTAISQRLSMGDVTPGGQRVTFDLTAYLRGTTTELVAAGTTAVDRQLATPAEVRTNWLGLPPRTDVPDTIRPAAPAAPAREDTPA